MYNLRKTRAYRNVRQVIQPARPTRVAIGERQPPDSNGEPGHLRVDTVHQGDQNGIKGVYHINLVDEATHWAFIGTVPKITKHYMEPMLEQAITSYPFAIIGFHSDNGSEFINHTVKDLQLKLHVDTFTKSRPRHCNDNALVESKNGSVIRKWFGYQPIPACFSDLVAEFNLEHLTPYLNFHRPCMFPTVFTNAKDKKRKRYCDQNVITPYEKLKSLPNAEHYLKPGITFEDLDKVAFAMSDLDAVNATRKACNQLFRCIDEQMIAAG